jgi:hypothetical protein
MFCSNCGIPLDDDVSYCPNCGKPTQTDTATEGKPTEITPVNYVTNGMGNNYQQSAYYQQPIYTTPVQQVPPVVVQVQQNPQRLKTANGYCVASFVLSMCCFFILPFLCGAAAVIWGIVGLITYDENKHTSKWMAIVGIIIGAIGVVVGLVAVSFIVALFDALGNYT